MINLRAPILLFEVSIPAKYPKMSAPGPFKTRAEGIEEQDRDINAESDEWYAMTQRKYKLLPRIEAYHGTPYREYLAILIKQRDDQ